MLVFKKSFGCCVEIYCSAAPVEAGRVVGADCDIPTGSSGLTMEDIDGFGVCAGQSRPDTLMDSATPVREVVSRMTPGFTGSAKRWGLFRSWGKNV